VNPRAIYEKDYLGSALSF